MPCPADDGLAATQVSGSRSAPLAPSSLDRILNRLQHAAQASDVLLVVATALLTLVDLAVWATDPVVENGRLPVSLALLVPALGALATAAVALRPRRRALALALLATTSIVLTIGSLAIGAGLPPSFAALFALALLTTGVLRSEPGRAAVVLTAFGAAAVAAEVLRPLAGTVYRQNAGHAGLVEAIDGLVVGEGAFGVAVGVGFYLRWSDWHRAMTADAARTEERLELARELHDLVGHYVTGMVVQAQAARHVARNQPAAAPAALERIEGAGTEALAAMRRMVGGLRDDAPIAPGGSWEEIDELIDDAVAQGEPVSATIDPDVRDLPAWLVPSVHRIIAESLTNVRRHAQAVTKVEVAVRACDDHLVVTVQDDGSEAALGGHDTFGIVGMRERAASLGGSLFAGPAPSGGWVVRAELPVEAPR